VEGVGAVQAGADGKAKPKWLTYSPPWCAHVVGEYEERTYDPETGAPEEQRVRMRCGKCGATAQATCLTGHTRDHVANFALAHYHADPFVPM
jgi:hypothetical protein